MPIIISNISHIYIIAPNTTDAFMYINFFKCSTEILGDRRYYPLLEIRNLRLRAVDSVFTQNGHTEFFLLLPSGRIVIRLIHSVN